MNTNGIEIGTPVTISIWTDSYPYEVIAIDGTAVTVREVEPINKDHWAAGCHTTQYVTKPNGKTLRLSDRGKHGWHVIGDYRSRYYGWNYKVRFGVARYYRDPSF